MNIRTSKEEDSPTKQEGSARHGKTDKASSSSSTWLRLKDPRIVRVSRAFGGKDRHSKVCTIRGLRDRRVRLSVPTAIQLYDLQDRLGLNQPSKAVDWLLNAAKQEIDELPPLPIAPMNFALNHHGIGANSQSNKDGFKIGNWGDETFWNSDSVSRAKLKQVERDTPKRTEIGDQQRSNDGQLGQYDRGAHCSSSVLMPYGSFFHLDHPNFVSSNSVEFESQNTVPLPPSALSLSSSSHFFTPQPYFTTQNLTSSADDDDPREINQFQMFSSSTQDLFPNSLSTSNPYSINDQSSGSSRGLHFNIN